MAKINLIGKRFGRWTVHAFVGLTKHRATQWVCLCDCGTKRVVLGSNLRKGSSLSCGCYTTEVNTKHGLSFHPLYHIFRGIKERCNNPQNTHYKWYGGRGIKCNIDTLEQFIAIVGPSWKAGLSVDRINNDGHYEAGNLRVVDASIQSRNRRSNRLITYNGETKLLIEWAEQLGISKGTLHRRIKMWGVDKALTTPRLR